MPARTSASTGGRPSPATRPPVSPAVQAYVLAPRATKNAWPRDNWPATPTSRVSPMAPTTAAIANRPVCNQKSSRNRGAASAASRARSAGTRRGRSDTDGLLAAEQPRGPHEQHEDHHGVGDDLTEATAEKVKLAFVTDR